MTCVNCDLPPTPSDIVPVCAPEPASPRDNDGLALLVRRLEELVLLRRSGTAWSGNTWDRRENVEAWHEPVDLAIKSVCEAIGALALDAARTETCA